MPDPQGYSRPAEIRPQSPMDDASIATIMVAKFRILDGDNFDAQQGTQPDQRTPKPVKDAKITITVKDAGGNTIYDGTVTSDENGDAAFEKKALQNTQALGDSDVTVTLECTGKQKVKINFKYVLTKTAGSVRINRIPVNTVYFYQK